MAKIHGNMGLDIDVTGDDSVRPAVIRNASGTEVFSITRTGDLDITTLDATTLKIGGTAVTSTAAELNILDGVTATAAEINNLDNADKIVKVVKVALTGRGDAGVLASWQNNEESAAIIVEKVLLDVTTAGGGAATADVGIAATAVTADTLLDDVDINAQALYDSSDATLDTGTNAHAQKCADDYYVTVFGSAACSSLVGNLYIFYVVV